MDKKDSIISTACRILSQGGSEALTMGNLASECGLSKASFYHYFSSKDEIMEEIFLRGHRNLMKRGFRMELRGSAEEVLRGAARHWEEMVDDEDNRDFLTVVFSLHLTDERARAEYRSLSLMLQSQVDVLISSQVKEEKRRKILSDLFSSLLFMDIVKMLEDEECSMEEDAVRFSLLLNQ